MKRLVRWLFAFLCSVFILGSGAQSTIPTVDLSVGPLATSSQAVNIALALSVEFPTAGAAYRNTLSYGTGTVYIGYWDSQGCYQYFDENDKSSQAGQYFWRTGDVDSNGYCNTTGAGTGYSGNMLNWAATSSIDNLRLALTGGNRIVDTNRKTVLGRAYLPSQFGDGGFSEGSTGYWPPKQIPSSLVGLVTPRFSTPGGSSAYTGTVYIKGCKDQIFFGNASSGGSCATPGNANIFAPYTPNLSGASVTQGFTTAPIDTPTTTYVLVDPPQAYWGRTANSDTTTTLPSGNDAVAGILIPEAVTPNPRTSTIISTGASPQYSGDPVGTVTWSASTGTTTTAPTAQSLYGTTTVAPTLVLGTTWIAVSGVQAILAELPAGAPQTILATNQTKSVCFNGSTQVALAANTPSPNQNKCVSPLTLKSTSGLTIYQQYATATVYRIYTASPSYNYYQTYSAWYVPMVYNVYTVYSNGTAPAMMKAAVRVCNTASEATSRMVSPGVHLCQSYPNGFYKPVGQLQINAVSVRASAFGYVIDNNNSRYGGVLRAPMKFVGPQYRDTSGAIQSNSAPEWDATTGVFLADPLGAAPTFNKSGVINYLNGFGGNGQYKGYDPVGELWYEALRYFQGLAPTPDAASSLTTAMYGGWPLYTPATSPAWVDPIQNGCQRSNFILTIGDVNTWYDKQLPGLSSLADSTDLARPAVTIPGTTKTFDATYWTSLLTGFETGTSLAYTDSFGRSQSTAGNPSPNSSNTNLQGKLTGAGSSSAYYWAGAAYWANTQAIRMDTSTDSASGKTQTMANIRVKTYTIDVDEGGNGLIDGNTRGIAPRQSSFYLAGKYGWFKDSNADGNPFGTTVNGLREWEDPTTPNTPDGYTLASQASRMIAGIQKFFAAAVSGGGSLSVSALSSQRYSASSQTGDVFSSSFDPTSWSGTLYKKTVVFNTSTFQLQLQTGNVWDAGQILTSAAVNGSTTLGDPFVAPTARNIWTYRRVTTGSAALAFNTSNASLLDSSIQTALNTNPASGNTDGRISDRINYLRGDRSQESGVSNPFRLRTSVMGDVINSGPVYKQGADPTVSGSGYADFAYSMVNRTATVYVGANDGMLHAFRASDGMELFAYIPQAVSKNLNRLTNPTYTHTPFVDGVPVLGEAQTNGNWRTVLAGGMGGGARGVYALDVTYPANFGDTIGSGSSSVMWEFTNQDDPMMGHVLGAPSIVKINVNGASSPTPAYKWFVAVGSGYNNYTDDGSGNFSLSGNQAMFLLSLDRLPTDTWQEGVNYFKIQVPIASTALANGLAEPGVLYGNANDAQALYAGDLQGRLWKFDFTGGLSASTASGSNVKKSSGIAQPLFTALDSNSNRQPITVAPLITTAPGSGYLVVLGTGKFMEQSDNNTVGVQGIYSVWDAGTGNLSDYNVAKNKLYQVTASAGSSTVALSTGTFVLGKSTGQYQGCYFNLPDTGERIGVQGDQGIASVTFNSLIPNGTCSGDGNSRSYQLYPASCGLANPVASQSNSGYLSKPNYVDIDYGSVNGGNYHSRRNSGLRKYDIREQPVSLTTGGGIVSAGGAGSSPPVQINAGRISWREIKSIN